MHFDPGAHPRWPTHAPDGRGGEFRDAGPDWAQQLEDQIRTELQEAHVRRHQAGGETLHQKNLRGLASLTGPQWNQLPPQVRLEAFQDAEKAADGDDAIDRWFGEQILRALYQAKRLRGED